MIKGIPVILYNKQQAGTDAFGEPIYTETAVTVDNVIVGQPVTSELVTVLDLNGKKAVYTLCIPKGDTHNWEDKKVRFFNRDWHTFGFCKEFIEDMCPLEWNKQINVEAYE